MSQKEKDTDFFRTLLSCHGEAECETLRVRIKENQENTRAIGRAVFLACVLGLTSLSGFGYSALFAPEILQNPSHLLFRLFAVAGLTSLICLISFSLHWIHYRRILGELHDDCRRFLLGTLPEKLSPRTYCAAQENVGFQDTPMAESQTFLDAPDSKLIRFSKIS